MVRTAITYIGPTLFLSMPIPLLSSKRLLSGLAHVQVNNLQAVDNVGQVDSALTPSSTPINAA